ncbi:MAG: hypothetical protein IJB24_03830 [Clostridia bacterium]|nr:hypothetical protein [Clostridia bacterium]MBQ4601970.1 hypothetical protein [Clostridia bacterium]
MSKKILLALRILSLVVFCGLVICFYFTDNYVGEAISLFSFMFISLLLSVIKDNMTKTKDGNNKNRPMSKKEKIMSIINITFAVILILSGWLYRPLHISVDYLYMIILPLVVFGAIINEVISYKNK